MIGTIIELDRRYSGAIRKEVILMGCCLKKCLRDGWDWGEERAFQADV